MREVVLIAHDIRSTHNVGSLMRTAEGLGVRKMYFTGYTPYPIAKNDSRLPHIARKLDAQIQKTALGAQETLLWTRTQDIMALIAELKDQGYEVVGLEQHKGSTPLNNYDAPKKVALLIGREVEGIEPSLLAMCDDILEIPMKGKKESFNVVQAAAMAMYHFRFSHL